METDPQKSTAREALVRAESEVARLHEELVQIETERAAEQDLSFKPDTQKSYKHAISTTKAELAMANANRASCLADVRAEDAERELKRERIKHRETRFMAVAAFLVTVAKVIYDLLK
jgi:hypothetical protein